MAGTKVLLADGTYRAIEDVEIGDEVLAGDPELGVTAARPVAALIIGIGQKHLVEITIGDDTGAVVATDGHPFWVESEGRFVPARDLSPGDVLRAADGRLLPITHTREWTQHRTVYNLNIQEIHTYHVRAGSEPVLVHNCGPAGEMAGAMRDMLAKKAGFSGNGQRYILDENLPTSLAQPLRQRGFNVRSVKEMGLAGTKDDKLNTLAEQLGARVITRDRGRQMDGGFGKLAINIDRRVSTADGIARIVRGG